MAGSLSLDDQLLGEKMHYYCSSSDEEYESCDDGMEHGNLSKGQSNYSRHTDDFSGAASNVKLTPGIIHYLSCLLCLTSN